ncbi:MULTISPECIES: recombinase family protein [Helcococcus]|uniref:Recombinase family protein n=1 Tax=Helcococcus bovis TaxID=3153252 RepID=A0ABW9F5R6_9FIRM
MERIVKTIPAKKKLIAVDSDKKIQKKNVAGYARVSTDNVEQQTSYEKQVDYYTNFIKSRPDWNFAGLYSDEGITGTSTKNREGFNRMINDALDGKIDLIITKSVSRFARNTVDSLTTVRKLKENGIEIYFEKENIWTLDSKGELLITIMSSLAQEESRSISENVTWGKRKRLADGQVSIAYSTFLGYDKGPDGNLVINKEEALVIKKIYMEYLNGNGFRKIADLLSKEGILTPTKKSKWSPSSVKSILTNEKYKGDALLQKYYCTDFLTKTRKVNNGEIPQYYIEKNHEAIIEPYIWDLVQDIIKNRNNKWNYFTGKVICGECGHFFKPRTWHSNSIYKRKVLQCNLKLKRKCGMKHTSEEFIKSEFIKELNKKIKIKDRLINEVEKIKDRIFDTKELEENLKKELNIVENLKNEIEDKVATNKQIIQNQDNYKKEYTELYAIYNEGIDKVTELEIEIEDKKNRKLKVEYYINFLKEQDGDIKEFKPIYWNLLLEKAIVKSERKIKFEFII